MSLQVANTADASMGPAAAAIYILPVLPTKTTAPVRRAVADLPRAAVMVPSSTTYALTNDEYYELTDQQTNPIEER
jgi:hypothetical protein